MWEISKVFCDVERLFQMSEDSFLFYYELKRHINPNMSDDVLLIFQTEQALMQFYYRHRKNADSEKSIFNNNIKRLFVNGVMYEFIAIENIYKKNNLQGRYFADIQLKNSFDRIT